MLSSANGWAVGGGYNWKTNQDESQIIYYDGVSWSIVSHPAAAVLNSISMLSPTSGWVVGNGGTILRWNGTDWSTFSSPTTLDLYAVDMVSESDGWAAGNSGVLLRWNGTDWTLQPGPSSASINGLRMLSANFGWAVGAFGTILYWDGSQWAQAASPTTLPLDSVFMANHYEAWAVGINGLILLYQAPKPVLETNYASGSPGSFFNVSGANFLPGSTETLLINGAELQTVQVDPTGHFQITLETGQAEEGFYLVSPSSAPAAQTKITLAASEPLREQEGMNSVVDLPTVEAYIGSFFVPQIKR